MWNRRELKRQGRRALKANYITAVIVCLVLSIFAGEYTATISVRGVRQVADFSVEQLHAGSNTAAVNDFIRGVVEENQLIDTMAKFQGDQKRGVLGILFNNITRAGSFLFGVLNSLNQFLFQDRVAAGIIILAGAILGFFYWLFVGNILRVGECRFFLENHGYRDTRANRILFLYQIRRWPHVAGVMFLRTLYNALWFFTIAGGFIKIYSYRLVPFILAENPTIRGKEAILLSRRMMKGQKWRTFIMDLTLSPWMALSFMTFGIVGYVYANPYTKAARTELYYALRELALKEKIPGCEALNDETLLSDTEPKSLQYPVETFYPSEKKTRHHWPDHQRTYSPENLVLIFFSFCLIGWLWEVSVELFRVGEFVNRGTLTGPWIPIYGFGGLLVLLLLRPIQKKPVATFFASTLLCGILEYITGWFLEHTYGRRWWEYDNYVLNIDGRVSLEGLLVFGFACCVGIYFLAPVLDEEYSKMPISIRRGIGILLLVLITIDWLHFHFLT